MKSIPISKFKQMKVDEIKDIGSFNLMADGELIAIVMIPVSAAKRTQLQAMASQMNAAIGK